MINKKLFAVTLSAILAVSTATIFASGWQKNDTGWWFGTNDTNTTWHANGWQWVDGNNDGITECYYFDQNGYALTNTTTPDGYQVNSDGAWTVNGVIQTQNVSTSAITSTNSATNTTSDTTWPIVTSVVGTHEWLSYVSDPEFCSKVASQFVLDNGGYNEYGISNAAVDMLIHSREENKKYGELVIAEEDPEGYGAGARITYRNGLTVYYAHTRKEKRDWSTNLVILEDDMYPILKNKPTYIFKYAGDDGAAVKKKLVSLGFDATKIDSYAFKTDLLFTFDGKNYDVIASNNGVGLRGNISTKK